MTPLEHSINGKDLVIREWCGRRSSLYWRVLIGPAKEALSLLDDESVDCVVTSPPYFWLRDYKVSGQIGLEDTVDGYVVAVTDVMSEVYRVMKMDGLLFLNIGDTYYSGKGKSHGVDKKSSKRRFGLRAVDKSGGLGIGLRGKSIIGIPWRVAIKMCNQNWILRSPIIWRRDKHLQETVIDRPRRSYEYIFMFSKSKKYTFHRQHLINYGNAEDVWIIPAKPKNGNMDTAPYPDELVERCLKIGCRAGGTVLDPFCGSGTTLRVALELGHNSIGIDLSPDFCDYVVKSLNKGA
jgi:DNA modification methylase